MERKAIAPEVGVLARGIDEEIDRLDRIVRELLEFARPGEPNPRCFDPAALLDKVLDMTRKSLEEALITVERDFNAVVEVWADVDQVRQIFLNLILNAAKAMQPGGRLRLAVGGDGEKVTVSIADDGCGIAPEHLDRIFDPFFTLAPGGTGLGLSLVHTLMQENGITYHLESVPGKGTFFELLFATGGSGE
jgi:signal transduction histidine kinase